MWTSRSMRTTRSASCRPRSIARRRTSSWNVSTSSRVSIPSHNMLIHFCAAYRNSAIQWQCFGPQRGARAAGAEDWGCEVKGYRRPQQNWRWRGQQEKARARIEDVDQREENDARETRLPAWEPMKVEAEQKTTIEKLSNNESWEGARTVKNSLPTLY